MNKDYSRKLIYGKSLPENLAPKGKQVKSKDGSITTKFENVDYKKFKLFLLSILWRASISSNSLFKDVQLGDHEDKLRKMIFNGDPGDVNDYPILIMSLTNKKSLMEDLIVQPTCFQKEEGVNIYKFVINGYIYFFYVSSDISKIPRLVLDSTIMESNKMNIIQIPSGSEMEIILGI